VARDVEPQRGDLSVDALFDLEFHFVRLNRFVAQGTEPAGSFAAPHL
jgi:hypothetical protein